MVRVGSYFLGLGTPPGRSWAAFWASWDCLGRSQERKNADGPMRKPFFENSLFRFLELSLALLGSSWRLLGRSWGQMAPKMAPKATLKLVPKLVQRRSRFLIVFGLILGPVLGSKMEVCRGPVFHGFSRWLGAAIVINTGALSRPVLAHLGALLAPSWSHLGTIWVPEGSTKQES